MKHNGSSCLVGEWRSVGSLPPDKAVWGRPSYALPVWRSVIINTAERILTRWPIDRSLRNARKATLSVERKTYAVTRIFPSGLEIPMAVTCARINMFQKSILGPRSRPWCAVTSIRPPSRLRPQDKTSSVAKSDRRDGPGGRVGGTQRRYESVSGTPPPMSGGPIAQLRQVAPTSEGSPELAPVFLDQDDGATSRLFVHVCGQPKPLMTTTHESTRRITLRHRGRFVMSAQAAGQSCCRRLDIGHLQITATVGLAP